MDESAFKGWDGETAMPGTIRALTVVILLGGLVLFTPASPAGAAGVVGTGNPASCTEAALDAALAGGGFVSFNCGPGNHTILLTGEKVIAADTTINGGNTITLDGQGQTRIFWVEENIALDLNAITLTGGNGVGAQESGVGGAIFSDAGDLTISDSTISGNSASNGGGIRTVNSTVTVSDSTISGNTAGFHGGGIRTSDGTVTISDSTFSGNSADNNSGGGIRATGGTVTISDSTFSGNTAGSDGGGIFTTGGTVTISDSTFSGNNSNDGGGILTFGGPITISDSTFSGNSAGSGGGIRTVIGPVTINGSTISGNSAGIGGGIFSSNGSVTFRNSTISGNSASSGGGIYRSGSGTVTIISSTLSGNTAAGSGDAIRRAGGAVRLQNTIIASGSGDNCVGAITSQDYNLSDDGTCSLIQANDLPNTPASLAPLGDYGGPTLTHHPFAGSAAIDSGSCLTPADQRGIPRPQGPDCDRGSVEVVEPVDLTTLCTSFYTGAVTSPNSGQCGAGQWQHQLAKPLAADLLHRPLHRTGQLRLRRVYPAAYTACHPDRR